MPRHWGSKVDKNHAQIKRELTELGFAVVDLSGVGDGCPDLLVARNDKQLLVELKTDKGRMTEAEVEFFRVWPLGLAIVARTTEDVLKEWELL